MPIIAGEPDGRAMHIQSIVTRHLTLDIPGKLRNARHRWSKKSISEAFATSSSAMAASEKTTRHSSSSVVLFLARLNVGAAMKHVHSAEPRAGVSIGTLAKQQSCSRKRRNCHLAQRTTGGTGEVYP